MKHLFIYIALVGLSLNAMADELPALIITRGTEQVAVALNEKPEVQFTETEVVLSTASQTLRYKLSDNVKLTLGTVSANDIKGPTGLRAIITCSEGCISVRHAEAGTPIALYAIDGKQQQATAANNDGEATITLQQQGVYVVKVGETTLKIQY